MCGFRYSLKARGELRACRRRGKMDQVVIAALFRSSHPVARWEGKADCLASGSCSGCSCREWEGARGHRGKYSHGWAKRRAWELCSQHPESWCCHLGFTRSLSLNSLSLCFHISKVGIVPLPTLIISSCFSNMVTTTPARIIVHLIIIAKCICI